MNAPSPLSTAPRQAGGRWLLALIILGALALRLGRLAWQPLWWDEGYSVYFATEPLARMLGLTAHDIHPPFYYALLHVWTLLFGSGPVALRLLSVAIGVLAVVALAWLARTMFALRPRVAWIAALLLAVSPIHIYYSQEVRMYGLALLLCVLATGWLWRAVAACAAGAPSGRPLALYALFATLALYTLYYVALLFAAQALWALWVLRRKRRRWVALAASWLAILLAYLPWLIYALPKLVAYVGQKVVADSDRPLNVLQYLARHTQALLVGHVAGGALWIQFALGLSILAIVLLAFVSVRVRTPDVERPLLDPVAALLIFSALPAAGAFLLNLRLPFFPSGGERLLLFILPFVLLLIASAADAALSAQPRAVAIGLALLFVSGLGGAFIFYTTPRYTQDDYRPLIRQAVQQGAPNDTFLATFPWMVGYWRAYAPSTIVGPTPLLLGDGAVEYTPTVAGQVDSAVARGTLWFPEPLGFGSSLPGQIEAHLQATSLNVENHWFSTTTRLSAWAAQQQPAAHTVGAAFANAPVLAAAGLQAGPIAAANNPLAIRLDWEDVTGDPENPLRVDLRLVDAANRTWAARSYSPPGALAATPDGSTDIAGIIVAAGTPPGVYTVTVGLRDADGQRIANLGGMLLPAAPIGTITTTLPAAALDLVQMPINQIVRRPRVDDGLALIGAELPQTPVLAGTTVSMRFAAENHIPTPPQRELYVTLLDARGNAAAAWQGWTLPDFPTALWPASARLLVPVEVDLPATLTDGRYTVVAGWVDVENTQRTAPVELGSISIQRRSASFLPEMPAHAFNPAPLLGTHALLEGYTLTRTATSLLLALDWQVEQPLLPPHHIYVHADGPDGVTIAQRDGEPVTSTGPAPTGTWQPGEHLRTLHTLNIPADAPALTLRVGLYNPGTQVRLPVSVDGVVTGDAVELTVLPPP